jgi:hypothetical protein
VVSLVVRPRWLERAARGGGGTPAALPGVGETPSPPLALVGRYGVGAKALAGAQAGALPEARSDGAAMVLNDQIWLVGGTVPGQVSNNDVLHSNP